jgi:hypothetical protein
VKRHGHIKRSSRRELFEEGREGAAKFDELRDIRELFR